MIPAEAQAFILEAKQGQRLGFVATVNPDGSPNLSPKGTTTLFDDAHLLFADIASPHTIENLDRDARVEINMVDPITRKGYRFRGIATVHRDGETYERGLEVLRARGSSAGPDRVKSIVVIEVTDVKTLISPAYDTGATEAEVSAGWRAHYAAMLS